MNDLDRQHRLADAALRGKEIFEIKPVVLGGVRLIPRTRQR